MNKIQQSSELTNKQKIFMRYIAQGLSNGKIAQQLHIQRKTADQYVERIKLRLDLCSKAEVKAYAIAHGYGEETQA